MFLISDIICFKSALPNTLTINYVRNESNSTHQTKAMLFSVE